MATGPPVRVTVRVGRCVPWVAPTTPTNPAAAGRAGGLLPLLGRVARPSVKSPLNQLPLIKATPTIVGEAFIFYL